MLRDTVEWTLNCRSTYHIRKRRRRSDVLSSVCLRSSAERWPRAERFQLNDRCSRQIRCLINNLFEHQLWRRKASRRSLPELFPFALRFGAAGNCFASEGFSADIVCDGNQQLEWPEIRARVTVCVQLVHHIILSYSIPTPSEESFHRRRLATGCLSKSNERSDSEAFFIVETSVFADAFRLTLDRVFHLPTPSWSPHLWEE